MHKSQSRPPVIDLFSGVGGLSLGAARAGFDVNLSVEIDAIASASHSVNFPRTTHLQQDVSEISGQTLLETAQLGAGQLAGLIGGPPCQGFSLIGRRQEEDPRNDLFGHFFRLVSETMPAFYLAENVPGILSAKTKPFVDNAMSVIPESYVRLQPLRIEAQKYGAATTRTRVFFIGYDPARVKDLSEVTFAAPLLEPTTVGTALAGLPGVRENWQTEEQSWRKTKKMPQSAFAEKATGEVPFGVGDPTALARLKERLVSGFLGTKHAEDTIIRFSALAPGQVDPVYRSPRLRLDGFCPTLRAGTSKDKGSYQAVRPIHPTAPRVISPREAARLQGFPDWFVFNPTKWHSFRQIGNSVSPIVAEYILRQIIHRYTAGD